MAEIYSNEFPIVFDAAGSKSVYFSPTMETHYFVLKHFSASSSAATDVSIELYLDNGLKTTPLAMLDLTSADMLDYEEFDVPFLSRERLKVNVTAAAATTVTLFVRGMFYPVKE